MDGDYDLVPVDHDPFADVPGVSVVPTSVPPAAAAMAQGVANQILAPGRVAQGVQPAVPGQWSDEDEARAQLAASGQYQWGPQQALNMMGGGTPFAEAGAAGIFGGKLAKTADLNALAKAQDMAAKGAYADEIIEQTGWFRGADGQWRFEIPDQTARFNKAAMQPQEYRFLGNSVTALTGKAGDVVSHPDLWAAYPDLANTTMVQGRGADFKGQFNRPVGPNDTPSIALNFDLLPTEEEARSTALHELQHAVQEKEGFAPGASADYMKGYQNPDYDKYRKALVFDRDLVRYKQLSASPEYQQELAAQNALWKQKYAPQLDEIEAKALAGGREAWASHKPLMDDVFERSRAEFAQLYPTMAEADRLYKSLNDRGIPVNEPKPTLDPYDAYRRTAGEVEARNVQRRMNMGAEERATLPPQFTEDIPRGEQITNVGAGGLYARSEQSPPGIRAFHGSPYDFDRFDLSKIGTGEGAQAYGHGLYFAENPEVARQYKQELTGKEWTVNGDVVGRYGYVGQDPVGNAAARIHQAAGDQDGIVTPDIVQIAKNRMHQVAKSNPGMYSTKNLTDISAAMDNLIGQHVGAQYGGKTYEVNIAADPEHFLDWDKPLSEQPQKVQDAFSAHLDRPDVKVLKDYLAAKGKEPTGADVYRTLASSVLGQANQDVNASGFLRQAGIPGIKYLDQGSRIPQSQVDAINAALEKAKAAGDEGVVRNLQAQLNAPRTSNYVVFDDKLIDIIRKYGLAGLIAGGASHFALTPVDHDPFPEDHQVTAP